MLEEVLKMLDTLKDISAVILPIKLQFLFFKVYSITDHSIVGYMTVVNSAAGYPANQNA